MKKISLGVLILLFTSCEGKKQLQINDSDYSLIRQSDCVHRVICYRFQMFEGMSCVQIDKDTVIQCNKETK